MPLLSCKRQREATVRESARVNDDLNVCHKYYGQLTSTKTVRVMNRSLVLLLLFGISNNVLNAKDIDAQMNQMELSDLSDSDESIRGSARVGRRLLSVKDDMTINTNSAIQIRSHYKEGPIALQKHGLLRMSSASASSFATNGLLQLHNNKNRNQNRKNNLNNNGYVGDDKESAMTAIVHIGPHKTGTTSIQAYTAILHKELGEDGYEMPWGLLAKDLNHVNNEPLLDLNQFNLVSCLQDRKELWPEAKCNPDLINATQKIASQGKNLILTAEEFSRTDIVHIDRLKTLLKPWKNVRIVAYYRRFYEWLFSYWHQFAKYKAVQYRQSFPQYISDLTTIKQLHDHTYTAGSVSHYRVYFNDVVIFNMHDLAQYHDVSEIFYCETFPEVSETTLRSTDEKTSKYQSTLRRHHHPRKMASLLSSSSKTPGAMPKTCEAVKDRIRHGENIAFNHAYPLVYEELAYHAEQANLWSSVGTNLTLASVADLTRKYHTQTRNKTQYDFVGYMICPNTELLEWLLQTTLDDEYEFFPEFFESKAGEKDIREQFERDRVTKLCSIDAERVIQQDQDWRAFYASLSN